MPSRRSLLAALSAFLLLPAVAFASDSGGTSTTSPGGTPGPSQSGGAEYAAPMDEAPPAESAGPVRGHGRPVLRKFRISRVVRANGSPARLIFRIDGGAHKVDVWVSLVRHGAEALKLDLGQQPTGRRLLYRWSPVGVNLPRGRYRVRIHAQDHRDRTLRTGPRAAKGRLMTFHPAPTPTVVGGRFPVSGPHSFGGDDARFGADRGDHKHQGQDITAAEGTPIVTPRSGKVIWRAYQRDGAGYYLVVHDDNGERDYVFMHLRSGSMLVNEGDHVRAGQRIAEVGNTGASSGAHLHFEIWEGGWYTPSGHPIDPLPSLKAWEAGR